MHGCSTEFGMLGDQQTKPYLKLKCPRWGGQGGGGEQTLKSLVSLLSFCVQRALEEFNW